MKLLLVLFMVLALNQAIYAERSTLATVTLQKNAWEGENITLNCQHRTRGSTQRTWKKDGHLLATNNFIEGKNPRLSIQDSGELTITSAKLSDSGEYRCFLKQRIPFSYVIDVRVKARDVTPQVLDERLTLVEEKVKLTLPTFQTNIFNIQNRVEQLEKEFGNTYRAPTIQTNLQKEVDHLTKNEARINASLLNSENGLQELTKKTEKFKADSQSHLDIMQTQIEDLKEAVDDTTVSLEGNITVLTQRIEHVQDAIMSERDEARQFFSSLDDRLKGLTKENRNSKIILDEQISSMSLQVQQLEKNLNVSIKLNQERTSHFDSQLRDIDDKMKHFNGTGLSYLTREQWMTEKKILNQLDGELTSLKLSQTTKSKEFKELLNNLHNMDGRLNRTGEQTSAMDDKISWLAAVTIENQKNITSLEKRLEKTIESFATRNEALQQSIDILEADGQRNKMMPLPILTDHNIGMMALRKGELVSVYTWDVHNMQTHLDTANTHTNSKYYLESKLFYTAIPGYRMVLKLYPDYKRTDHVGLFVGLRVGEFDDVIPWPFTNNYVLSMRIGETGQLIDEKKINSKNSPSCATKFRRPTDNTESSCGYQSFVSHESLNEYLANSSGHLQISIAVYLASL